MFLKPWACPASQDVKSGVPQLLVWALLSWLLESPEPSADSEGKEEEKGSVWWG